MLFWKVFAEGYARHMTPVAQSVHQSSSRGAGNVKLKPRQQYVVAIILLIVTRPAVANYWNSTCPNGCHCQQQQSEISHKTLLKTVNCSHQRLKSAPANIPPEVEALLLSSNELSDLYDYIPKLWTLKELDLTGNSIHSLGRDYIFHNLSELTYLNLAKNELTSIIRDVFTGLLQLQVLILSENKISYIEPQAFEDLSRLLTLNLGWNQINSIEPECFYGLPRLSELYMFGNRISLINSATFNAVRRLQHLSLHGNRIKHIVSDGLAGLEDLNVLQLERNNLERVPTEALRPLKALKVLYLSDNPIPSFRAGDFSSLNLEELSINAMPALKMIEAMAFYNMTKLVNLEISDCPKLAYVDAEAFVNSTVLKQLNLQNNRLRSVPQQLYHHVLRSGGHVALKGNPFRCDCNVRWMRKEMEVEASRNRTFLERDQLLCDEPEHAHGAQIQHLELSALPSQCSPSIFDLMRSDVVRRLGESLSLDCRGQGIPAPKITWKLPGGAGSLDNAGNRSSNHVRIQMRNSGTLYFYHLKEEDSGNYTCEVDNALGRDETTISVLVHPLDIHLFPIGVSSTFVTLAWNGTARASYPKYKIIYRQTSTGSNASSSSSSNTKLNSNCVTNSNCISVTPFHHSYNIFNLHPDTKYEFCLTIEDPNGYYVQVSCTVVTTQDVNYMLQGIHRMSNVAVAVVLGVIVTMVMVICVVTVAAKKYRHRQYVCPDKYPVNRMSHIPMENLYCPLMSNASPY